MNNNNKSYNKRIYILGGCIILLSAFLLVLFVCGHPFSEKSSSSNKENSSNTNNSTVKDGNKEVLTEISDEEINSLNLNGIYYNSGYQDLYFELKDNKKAIIVGSTCSNGPAPAVDASYKVSKNNKGNYIVTLYYDQGTTDEPDVVEFNYQYAVDNGKTYFISLVNGCAEEEGITEFRTK